MISLHRAGEGGSLAVRDIFFIPATSEFGIRPREEERRKKELDTDERG